MDHFSRLALLGAFLALEDAAAPAAARDRMALILATGYGAAQTTFAFLDSYLDNGDICASPTHFSTSVHNAAAANIAIALGVQGPTLTVSQFELSTVSALLTASQWLATGRVDTVLFGNVDECCPVLEYGWDQLRESAPATAIPAGHHPRPPGEGAAFFLLARGDATTRYGGVTDIHLGRLADGTPPCQPESRIILNDQRATWPRHPEIPLPAGLAHAVSYEPVYGRLPVGPAFDLAIAALSLQAEATDPAAGSFPIITCLTLARDQSFGRITCQRDGN